MKIKNGDVFDIGQTVNGVSKFLWFNGIWYYFEEIMSYKYEYSQESLTELVDINEFDEVNYLGNIFKTFEQGFKEGIKWQAERMFSEKDMRIALYSDGYKYNSFEDFINLINK